MHTASNGVEYLAFNERQTKTRSGEDLSDIRKVTPKLWANPTDPERCPIALYKHYCDKRPVNFSQPEHPFYLAPRTTAITNNNDQWFTKNPVGEKKLGSMLKQMAQDGDLDPNKRLTNHATRKRLVSKLREQGIAPTDIVQISGHKRIESVLNYSSLPEKKHQEISNILSGSRPPVTNTCVMQNLEPTPTASATNVPTDLQNVTVPVIPVAQSQTSVASMSTYPTHLTQNTATNSPNFNIRHSTNNQLQSLFGGATLNIQHFNLYMQ